MEYEPNVTPSAEADIAEACHYMACDLRNPQAASDFSNGIYEVIYSLDTMPYRNPVWPREPWKSMSVRWTGFKNFNIFYRIDEEAKKVEILRVFYNRRNV